MRGRRSIGCALLLPALFAGCGQAPGSLRSEMTVSATRPARSNLAPARLTLDEIQPPVSLATAPTTPPTTAPTTGSSRAPIEAINLYAQAVDALRTGRRFTAINTLDKAIALDPNSFELHYALGRAYLIGRSKDDAGDAIASFERAAAIQPDHLELQTDLGRQYLARGDAARALTHLRLAVQTSAYRADDTGSAVADLFLARALQQTGYDRAALEQYAVLLRRMSENTLSLSRDPQLAFLLTDRLYVDIGDLYARNGQLDDALAAFEPAARRDPADFELEARVVRALTGLKRFGDASTRAADAVVRFRASKPSLDLLREVHRRAARVTGDGDGDRGTADALARMARERPTDTTVLLALVELLREDGRWADADGQLAAAAARSPNDFGLVRRRVQLRLELNDVDGAARLLVAAVAQRPAFAEDTHELWEDLTSPARPGYLRLAQLQAMPVLPSQVAAHAYCVAVVAEEAHRNALSEQAIDRALSETPAFAPVFRARVESIWKRRGLDEAERLRLTDALVGSAASSDPALAHELRGLALLYRKQDKQALAEFEQAMATRPPSPSLAVAYALAFRGSGDAPRFEQNMWKLLSDHPSYENGYSTLYEHYSDTSAEAQADRVLNTWLTAIPYSTTARLLQSARHFRAGRLDAAQQTVDRLLDERPGDAGVIRTAYALYTKSGKIDALVARLESRLRAEPGNMAALSALAEIYDEKQRGADAVPLVDAARAALADDPDQLYQIAHLYQRAGRLDANEDVLRRVLELEPTHPPASNDLGYTWAERGENLPRAEALIRQAVEAEPDNASFLDSLGWVLYKRGKFAEARPNLEKSIGTSGAQADPVVLDHLGDVLYRLGETDAAAKQWERAGTRIKDNPALAERDDIKQLKTALDRKAEELKAGKPVTVSPVVEESRQAKN